MNESVGSKKPSFVIVGCGKVGTSLARFLCRAGYPAAAAVSRSEGSAKRAAELCRAPHWGTDLGRFAPGAALVLITTPDGEIEDTCRRMAQEGGFSPGAVVLHCSGALPSTILAAAKSAGARTGSLHPLQSFAAASSGESPFTNIVFAVEGDKEAVSAAEMVATDLGGKSIQVNTEGKGLYHAAAVAASNYLVSLADMAYGLLFAAGISEEQAPEILAPLIEGTLSNIGSLGPPRALTGPVARNDHQTVLRHLADIDRLCPHLDGLYRCLGRHTVDVARRGGHLTADAAEAFLQLFAEKPPEK